MAKRLDEKQAWGDPTARRTYDWDKWQDGSAWEIYREEDYDVSTPAMQSMLHQRATQTSQQVKSRRFRRFDENGTYVEGLRFQFSRAPKPVPPASTA